MPKIKLEKVISFSSEDSVHVANNLLNNDSAKKWKCKTTGEKSASVVFQLETPSVISNIDIGNEHSAYIEVLVNRSSSNDDYKGLLVMSSFMSPLESRQSTNINKVRMFSHEQLSKPECTEKWDRIKVICTQPFNRHVQYGLSFITLHSLEDKAATSSSISLNNFGKFALRPASPDAISAGSLFAKRKEKNEDNVLTAAAAIRAASCSPASVSKKSPLLKDLQNIVHNKRKTASNDADKTSIARNRDEILYDDDEIAPNDKIDAIVNKKNDELRKRKIDDANESIKNNTPQKKAKKDLKDVKAKTDSNKDRDKNSEAGTSSMHKNKQKQENENKTKKISSEKQNNTKPFNELLNGVTLVISGIENPDRATIRTLAMELGAKYKTNWDNTCTHLICAFANTPKFNQVKGKGKIITRKWIEDCYGQRKRLPWRRYALEKSEKRKDESEDEILEFIEEQPATSPNDSDDAKRNVSGSDTEDEIERVMQKQNDVPKSIYEEDTDEEPTEKKVDTNKKLVDDFPNFFNAKLFYVDNNLKEDEKKLLAQHIVAYNGQITHDISKHVDIIVTDALHVDAVRNRTSASDCKYVVPDWVWKCHNEQKTMSTEKFEL